MRNGQGALFNGTSSDVNFGTGPVTSGSVSFWAYPTRSGINYGPGLWQNTGFLARGDTWLEIALLPTNHVRVYYDDGSPRSFDTPATIPLNAWTHITYAWSTGGSTLYLNGVQAATSALTWSNAQVSAQPFVIGKGAGPHRDGLVPGVHGRRVYNRQLSDVEVAGLVSQGGSVILKYGSRRYRGVAAQRNPTVASRDEMPLKFRKRAFRNSVVFDAHDPPR